MLGECWGNCHWGHYPCHHPRTLGKGWCQVHSWFPNGPWKAFQMLLRVVWTPQAIHTECDWVKRGWGLQVLLEQNIWMILSKSVSLCLSCFFIYWLKRLDNRTLEVLTILNILWLWNSLQTSGDDLVVYLTLWRQLWALWAQFRCPC